MMSDSNDEFDSDISMDSQFLFTAEKEAAAIELSDSAPIGTDFSGSKDSSGDEAFKDGAFNSSWLGESQKSGRKSSQTLSSENQSQRKTKASQDSRARKQESATSMGSSNATSSTNNAPGILAECSADSDSMEQFFRSFSPEIPDHVADDSLPNFSFLMKDNDRENHGEVHTSPLIAPRPTGSYRTPRTPNLAVKSANKDTLGSAKSLDTSATPDHLSFNTCNASVVFNPKGADISVERPKLFGGGGGTGITPRPKRLGSRFRYVAPKLSPSRLSDVKPATEEKPDLHKAASGSNSSSLQSPDGPLSFNLDILAPRAKEANKSRLDNSINNNNTTDTCEESLTDRELTVNLATLARNTHDGSGSTKNDETVLSIEINAMNSCESDLTVFNPNSSRTLSQSVLSQRSTQRGSSRNKSRRNTPRISDGIVAEDSTLSSPEDSPSDKQELATLDVKTTQGRTTSTNDCVIVESPCVIVPETQGLSCDNTPAAMTPHNRSCKVVEESLHDIEADSDSDVEPLSDSDCVDTTNSSFTNRVLTPPPLVLEWHEIASYVGSRKVNGKVIKSKRRYTTPPQPDSLSPRHRFHVKWKHDGKFSCPQVFLNRLLLSNQLVSSSSDEEESSTRQRKSRGRQHNHNQIEDIEDTSSREIYENPVPSRRSARISSQNNGSSKPIPATRSQKARTLLPAKLLRAKLLQQSARMGMSESSDSETNMNLLDTDEHIDVSLDLPDELPRVSAPIQPGEEIVILSSDDDTVPAPPAASSATRIKTRSREKAKAPTSSETFTDCIPVTSNISRKERSGMSAKLKQAIRRIAGIASPPKRSPEPEEKRPEAKEGSPDAQGDITLSKPDKVKRTSAGKDVSSADPTGPVKDLSQHISEPSQTDKSAPPIHEPRRRSCAQKQLNKARTSIADKVSPKPARDMTDRKTTKKKSNVSKKPSSTAIRNELLSSDSDNSDATNLSKVNRKPSVHPNRPELSTSSNSSSTSSDEKEPGSDVNARLKFSAASKPHADDTKRSAQSQVCAKSHGFDETKKKKNLHQSLKLSSDANPFTDSEDDVQEISKSSSLAGKGKPAAKCGADVNRIRESKSQITKSQSQIKSPHKPGVGNRSHSTESRPSLSNYVPSGETQEVDFADFVRSVNSPEFKQSPVWNKLETTSKTKVDKGKTSPKQMTGQRDENTLTLNDFKKPSPKTKKAQNCTTPKGENVGPKASKDSKISTPKGQKSRAKKATPRKRVLEPVSSDDDDPYDSYISREESDIPSTQQAPTISQATASKLNQLESSDVEIAVKTPEFIKKTMTKSRSKTPTCSATKTAPSKVAGQNKTLKHAIDASSSDDDEDPYDSYISRDKSDIPSTQQVCSQLPSQNNTLSYTTNGVKPREKPLSCTSNTTKSSSDGRKNVEVPDSYDDHRGLNPIKKSKFDTETTNSCQNSENMWEGKRLSQSLKLEIDRCEIKQGKKSGNAHKSKRKSRKSLMNSSSETERSKNMDETESNDVGQLCLFLDDLGNSTDANPIISNLVEDELPPVLTSEMLQAPETTAKFPDVATSNENVVPGAGNENDVPGAKDEADVDPSPPVRAIKATVAKSRVSKKMEIFGEFIDSPDKEKIPVRKTRQRKTAQTTEATRGSRNSTRLTKRKINEKTNKPDLMDAEKSSSDSSVELPSERLDQTKPDWMPKYSFSVNEMEHKKTQLSTEMNPPKQIFGKSYGRRSGGHVPIISPNSRTADPSQAAGGDVDRQSMDSLEADDPYAFIMSQSQSVKGRKKRARKTLKDSKSASKKNSPEKTAEQKRLEKLTAVQMHNQNWGIDEHEQLPKPKRKRTSATTPSGSSSDPDNNTMSASGEDNSIPLMSQATLMNNHFLDISTHVQLAVDNVPERSDCSISPPAKTNFQQESSVVPDGSMTAERDSPVPNVSLREERALHHDQQRNAQPIENKEIADLDNSGSDVETLPIERVIYEHRKAAAKKVAKAKKDSTTEDSKVSSDKANPISVPAVEMQTDDSESRTARSKSVTKPQKERASSLVTESSPGNSKSDPSKNPAKQSRTTSKKHRSETKPESKERAATPDVKLTDLGMDKTDLNLSTLTKSSRKRSLYNLSSLDQLEELSPAPAFKSRGISKTMAAALKMAMADEIDDDLTNKESKPDDEVVSKQEQTEVPVPIHSPDAAPVAITGIVATDDIKHEVPGDSQCPSSLIIVPKRRARARKVRNKSDEVKAETENNPTKNGVCDINHETVLSEENKSKRTTKRKKATANKGSEPEAKANTEANSDVKSLTNINLTKLLPEGDTDGEDKVKPTEPTEPTTARLRRKGGKTTNKSPVDTCVRKPAGTRRTRNSAKEELSGQKTIDAMFTNSPSAIQALPKKRRRTTAAKPPPRPDDVSILLSSDDDEVLIIPTRNARSRGGPRRPIGRRFNTSTSTSDNNSILESAPPEVASASTKSSKSAPKSQRAVGTEQINTEETITPETSAAEGTTTVQSVSPIKRAPRRTRKIVDSSLDTTVGDRKQPQIDYETDDALPPPKSRRKTLRNPSTSDPAPRPSDPALRASERPYINVLEESDLNTSSISSSTATSLRSTNSERLVFVMSSLSANERSSVNKCAKLLGAKIIESFTPQVTHLITSVSENGGCLRTFKFMRAVLHGKFIVNPLWALQCLNERSLVDEAPYEVSGPLQSVSTNGPRRARQAKSSKEEPLFSGCEVFIASDITGTGRADLSLLLRESGAKILKRNPREGTPGSIRYAPKGHPLNSTRTLVLVLKEEGVNSFVSQSNGSIVCTIHKWIYNCISAYTIVPIP